jgi:hypothetical protein
MLTTMGDVHSNMGLETKNLPGGYAPAAVPFTDRTGTQKEEAGSTETEAASSDSGDAGEGSGSKTASKTAASKSTTTKAADSK